MMDSRYCESCYWWSNGLKSCFNNEICNYIRKGYTWVPITSKMILLCRKHGCKTAKPPKLTRASSYD